MTNWLGTMTRSKKWLYLRDLLLELVARDMKLRYKRSALGFAWSLLNPLAQLLVFNFVFIYVLPLKIPNYASFLFCGLLAWNWFQSSILSGSSAVVEHRDLVRRPGFPVVILPIIAVTTQFIHFLLALPVLALFIGLGGIQFHPTILILPVLFVVQFLFTLSLIYFLSALHVNFRDTQYLLGIALLLGFYLSPVFYEAGNIPVHYLGWYRLNPMVTFLESYRAVLLHGAGPDWLALLVIFALSLILLVVGVKIFRSASLTFIEEL